MRTAVSIFKIYLPKDPNTIFPKPITYIKNKLIIVIVFFKTIINTLRDNVRVQSWFCFF